MLSLIAYRTGRPATEAVDRDPGVITLAFAAYGAVRRWLSASASRSKGAADAGRLPHPLP